MTDTKAPNPEGFTDALENICRERCAEYGDPPCWQLPELVQPCEHITPCHECWADLLTAAEARAEAAEAERDADRKLLSECEDWLERADKARLEAVAERDEALRRRDAWKERAEGHVDIVNALKAKTAGKDSRTLSRALLGAAFTQCEAERDRLVALVEEAMGALGRLVYLQSGGPCTGIQSEQWLSDARATLAKMEKTDET